MSPFIQFYSDSDRYALRGRDDFVLKKNYAKTDTFKFSFLIGLLICGIRYHCQTVVLQVSVVFRRE